MNKPSKTKLLELLKKNGYTKQGVADFLGIDEKTVRRWCKQYNVDVDFERKKELIDHEPLDVVHTISKKTVRSSTSDKAVKVKNDGKQLTRKVFVFSDLQIPYHNKQALAIALARCRDYLGDKSFKGETHCVIIGDYMDYEPLLGKSKARYPTLTTEELKSLDLEFATAAKVLEEIEKSLPAGCAKVFMKGNHEDRADQIIRKPDGEYWRRHIDLDQRLKLTERDWKVFEYNTSHKIGHLHFTHGAFFNQHHAYKHAQAWGKNVMYGHTHQIQVFTMPSPVRELPVWAASIGCLADVAPEWQRGKPNAHDHAFAEVDYIGDDFFPSIRRIIHGKLAVPGGKIYTA